MADDGLHIGGKQRFAGLDWDVNNIRRTNLTTNHVTGEQTVELIVVLTRDIPKQGEQ